MLFGSFNPVTKAHFMLLQHALDEIGADKGLFVATADSYLKKKAHVKQGTPFILSEDIRKEMLESLNKEDERISFFGYEMGGANPNSAKTIMKIHKAYPEYELYYLCGADKIKSLDRWNDIEDILKQFNFLVYDRNSIDIDSLIESKELLLKYKEHFSILSNLDETVDISSTKLREKFFNNEDYSMLMNVGPYNILNKYSPSDFKELTFEETIATTMKYGGRFAGAKVRKMIFEKNSEMFNNWDESLFGNKEYKLNGTKVYKEEFKVQSSNYYETTYSCYNDDAVDVAYNLINEGFNPAILNLASNVRPCGGYDDGTLAQEESLCYSSTLSQSLYQFGNPKSKGVKLSGLTNIISGVYPLNVNYGGIYSPGVCFFRNSYIKKYSLRDKPFECPVITVASLSNRKKNNYTNDESRYFNLDGTLTSEGVEIEKNKIRTIYRIGLDNNHDSLVLGAFGCGVYNLLPSEVSKLFMDVLNEEEFKNKYKRIVFAILESRKRGALTGVDGKFSSFYEIWN